MSPPLPQAHHHPTPLLTLVPHLHHHLPHSLPLLRRISHPTATTSPTALILSTLPASLPTVINPTTPPFAALFVDRGKKGETECWLFSTFETAARTKEGGREEENEAEDSALARTNLLALFNAIPPSPNSRSDGDILIVGAVSEPLLPLLAGRDFPLLIPVPILPREGGSSLARSTLDKGVEKNRVETAPGPGVVASISIPYTKYLIAPPPPAPTPGKAEIPRSLSLPEGYVFSPPKGEQDLKLAVSRTDIPYSVDTMSLLTAAGVRYHGELIAWVFLGLDGSLKVLHVEPGHRGRGLAKGVCVRVMRGAEGGDGGEWDGWVHSDVAAGNEDGAGVARGLGGTVGWGVRWVGVDLGVVGEVCGGGGGGAG